MLLPTQAQVNAALRHVGTIAGTLVVVFGLQAKGISVEKVQAGIQSLGEIINNLIILAGTVGALVAAYKASTSASPSNQASSIRDSMANPNVSAETKQDVLNKATDAVAVAAHSDEPEVAKTAKIALLDTTASLPEVVGKINVTDSALVRETVSDQVQKAA